MTRRFFLGLSTLVAGVHWHRLWTLKLPSESASTAPPKLVQASWHCNDLYGCTSPMTPEEAGRFFKSAVDDMNELMSKGKVYPTVSWPDDYIPIGAKDLP